MCFPVARYEKKETAHSLPCQFNQREQCLRIDTKHVKNFRPPSCQSRTHSPHAPRPAPVLSAWDDNAGLFKLLRRNPLGNGVILLEVGQKSSTRII